MAASLPPLAAQAAAEGFTGQDRSVLGACLLQAGFTEQKQF
jgi:hypothetical protein